MRIADIVRCTDVEGPGKRTAVWFQGCSIRCPDCCNPSYFDPAGGMDADPIGLAKEIAGLNVAGVTLHSEEPLGLAAAGHPGPTRVEVEGVTLHGEKSLGFAAASHLEPTRVEVEGVTLHGEKSLGFAAVSHLEPTRVEVEGVTLLGGEPLDQAEELEVFLRCFRAISSLGVFLFTGHTWPTVQERFAHLVRWCDIIKCGPFVKTLTPDNRRWIGSANQTIHFVSDRYRPMEENWPRSRREIEIHLDNDWITINGSPFADDLFFSPGEKNMRKMEKNEKDRS